MSQGPAAQVAEHSFSDSDALAAEFRRWDLDLRQLDKGPFRGELLQVDVGDAHIMDTRFSQTVSQVGSSPAALRTIGVPANPDTQFIWRGQQITGDSLIVFPPGAEFFGVSNPGFRVYVCSFSEELLATISDSLGMDELDVSRGTNEAVRCNKDTMIRLQRLLRSLCECIRNDRSALTNPRVIDTIRCDIPGQLLRSVACANGACPPAASRRREEALRRAATFIERFAQEPITIRDICHAVNVSQRTLEYAFVDRYGITPTRFLLTFRLNAVRRELLAANASVVKVADIANRWSFWHMGKFASDYRNHFGELPSQTLRKRG